MEEYVDISVLVGKTIVAIKTTNDEELKFFTSDGGIYRMYHQRHCCEYVAIDDIVGDLNDLLHSPITLAEERTGDDDIPAKDSYDESYTWTFYTLATAKGYVDIRWYGASNGYYSEEVDFVKIK